MSEYRYNKLNEYLKDKFGERTLKICVNGGFTCPNRDGSISYGGCIFCSEHGSGDHLNCTNSISGQVKDVLNSYKSERANKFIVYFQNFTNTYDSLQNLKIKYDSALIDSRIVGIDIATRPDCINDSICKLLASYSENYYVCVELGLQTSNDKIGNIINRGYNSIQFTNAVNLLNKYNINVVVHLMVGLPTETFDDIKNTVSFINNHKIQGIKIHSTYVVRGTKLANLYQNNQYTPITLEYYLDCVTYILTHISPNIVVHRISGDAPKDLLLAPSWNVHKKWILNGIDKKLKDENLYQGIYYKKDK